MSQPYLDDGDFQLWNGDALTVLRELPSESVHCCVTSPPYWGLRDYGAPGQLGLEETPEQYVAALVEVFREVRRVLRRDGTVWLNLGDSYNAYNGNAGPASGIDSPTGARSTQRPKLATGHGLRTAGLKPKDLCMVPARAALALQADGWYLRSQVIWSKPNPMPESVTDRPTTSHEYVFLLSRSPRYFFDQEAVREPNETTLKRPGYTGIVENRTSEKYGAGMEGRRERHGDNGYLSAAGRNLRSVWEIATQPYPQAHFATYPEELVRRCILAGTSERGCCPECGAPWVREVERGELTAEEQARIKASEFDPARAKSGEGMGQSRWENRARDGVVPNHYRPATTIGWRPSCECHGRFEEVPEIVRIAGTEDTYTETKRVYLMDADCPPPIPGIVLDPFGGSGTTALVARKHGRRSILIELSSDYCKLNADRLSQLSLLSEPA